MLINKKTVLVVVYVTGFLLWFLDLHFQGYSGNPEKRVISALTIAFLVAMTIMPLLGGLFGLINSRLWGGSKSYLGRSLGSISLGLLTWGMGMFIWNIYLLILNIEVPYPSLADGVFVLSWPLWIYGVVQLTKVLGVRTHLRSKDIFSTSLPILMCVFILLCYGAVWFARSGALIDPTEPISIKVFFDIFYPVGTIAISMLVFTSYVWSKKFLGGRFKLPTLFLFGGFAINYLADTLFSYSTNNNIYYNGHVSDLLFFTAMFLLSFGLAQIRVEN